MTEPYQLTAGDMMLNLILSNSDGHLSLENATSPLYGLVKPHVPLRIVANDGITERVMWQGWIQIIMPSVGQYSERTVEIIAHSPHPFYTATETRLTLQEGKRTDQIIAQLMQQYRPPRVERSSQLTSHLQKGNSMASKRNNINLVLAISLILTCNIKLSLAQEVPSLRIQDIAWHPLERMIAIASSEGVFLYSVDNGTINRFLALPATQSIWNHHGTFLATNTGNSISIFQYPSGDRVYDVAVRGAVVWHPINDAIYYKNYDSGEMFSYSIDTDMYSKLPIASDGVIGSFRWSATGDTLRFNLLWSGLNTMDRNGAVEEIFPYGDRFRSYVWHADFRAWHPQKDWVVFGAEVESDTTSSGFAFANVLCKADLRSCDYNSDMGIPIHPSNQKVSWNPVFDVVAISNAQSLYFRTFARCAYKGS
jgi:hypothetical protein